MKVMKRNKVKIISLLMLVVLALGCISSCGSKDNPINSIVKVPVEQVILNQTQLTLKETETFTLKCTVVPEDASNQEVSWVSSDEAVATVDDSGEITAQKAGSCTIIATVDGKTAMVNVTVKIKGPDFQKIYSEYAGSTWIEVGSDGSYLSIDTNPYNIDDYNVSAAILAIEDINTALELPDSLYNDILATTAMMGRQNETFESLGLSVSWSYHPDNGMEINYKLLSD